MPVNLDIDKLLNNPNAKVQIVGLSQIIEAFITSDFDFNMSGNWSAPDQNGVPGNDTMNTLISGVNTMSGSSVAQQAVVTPSQTMLQWGGNGELSLKVDLAFIALRENQNTPWSDVRIPCKILCEAVLGATSNNVADAANSAISAAASVLGVEAAVDRSGFGIMAAPNGITSGNMNDSTGKMSLRIGKWFKTVPVFVVESFDFSFSKVTTPAGLPLYASGSCSLKSYRMLTLAEVQGFFVGSAPSASVDTKAGANPDIKAADNSAENNYGF